MPRQYKRRDIPRAGFRLPKEIREAYEDGAFDDYEMYDATSPLRVHVTKADIQKAKKGDRQSCGFAIACKRQEHLVDCWIKPSVAYLIYEDKVVRYRLPLSMMHEIVAFDRGGIFAEGEYQLSVKTPPEPKPVGGHSRAPKKSSGFKHYTASIRSSY